MTIRLPNLKVKIPGFSMHLMRTRGISRTFRGHNQYGFWLGMNLIPHKFGFYIDFGKP